MLKAQYQPPPSTSARRGKTAPVKVGTQGMIDSDSEDERMARSNRIMKRAGLSEVNANASAGPSSSRQDNVGSSPNGNTNLSADVEAHSTDITPPPFIFEDKTKPTLLKPVIDQNHVPSQGEGSNGAMLTSNGGPVDSAATEASSSGRKVDQGEIYNQTPRSASHHTSAENNPQRADNGDSANTVELGRANDKVPGAGRRIDSADEPRPKKTFKHSKA